MTTEQILALQPGPELDQAVHASIFGGVGKVKAFSTKDADAITLLDKLPLYVSATAPTHPKYDPARPFHAGTLVPEATVKGDVTRLRLTAATRAVALCKAALMLAHGNVRTTAPTQPAPSLAAIVGTPAARGAARLRRPAADTQPSRAQPRVFTQKQSERAPMPKRVTEFRGPKPVNTQGHRIT